MNSPVVWFEIYVNDMHRAREFYQAVFDIELEKLADTQFEMWAFPMHQDTYGASGALIKVPEYPSGANSTIVYFSCDDCAVETERAEKAGGIVEKPKMSIGQYGFVSLVVDTEGNMIGLHSMQ